MIAGRVGRPSQRGWWLTVVELRWAVPGRPRWGGRCARGCLALKSRGRARPACKGWRLRTQIRDELWSSSDGGWQQRLRPRGWSWGAALGLGDGAGEPWGLERLGRVSDSADAPRPRPSCPGAGSETTSKPAPYRHTQWQTLNAVAGCEHVQRYWILSGGLNNLQKTWLVTITPVASEPVWF